MLKKLTKKQRAILKDEWPKPKGTKESFLKMLKKASKMAIFDVEPEEKRVAR